MYENNECENMYLFYSRSHNNTRKAAKLYKENFSIRRTLDKNVILKLNRNLSNFSNFCLQYFELYYEIANLIA